MTNMNVLKRAALATGLYRPARFLHRCLYGRKSFTDGKKFYARFIKPGDLCFDIGANIGEKTEIFLSLGARVISIERQPDLAREVAARFPKRKPCGEVIQKIVSDHSGTKQLHLKQATGQASLLSDWQGIAIGTIEVEATTLDCLIQQYGKPFFIKIDVEGAESQVLRGLSHDVPFITIEYHGDQRGKDQVGECLGLLARTDPKITRRVRKVMSCSCPNGWGPMNLCGSFRNASAQHFYGDLIIRAKLQAT